MSKQPISAPGSAWRSSSPFIRISPFTCFVKAGLFLFNILTMPDYLWFFWPLLGWGIRLGIHAFWTFAGHRIFGKDWEERQIRKILEREK